MKKLIALVLTLACVLALTGCGKNDTYKIKLNKIAARWPAKAVAQLSFSQ